MQVNPKSNSIITSKWDPATGVLTFTVLGVKDPVILNVRALAGEKAYDQLTDNGKRMILHGGVQRVSDRAAIARDKTTGQSATPAEKHQAMKVYADHLTNGGSWDLAGGGLPPVNRACLYQAIAIVRSTAEKPIDPVQVERVYRDKPDEVLRTFLTHPQIAGKYTELVKAVSTPNAQVDALFKELETEEPKQEAA